MYNEDIENKNGETLEKKQIIETKRLILRELSIDDLDAWYEIFNSNTISKYLTKYTDKSKLLDLINKKISKYNNSLGSSFSLVLKETNKVIGSFELKHNNMDNTAEMSYVINEHYWQKGYATEGANALLDYAFNYLNVAKVKADCKEHNDISIHMLINKLNMKFIKYEKDYMFDEYLNKMVGFNFYELTKNDYMKTYNRNE